MYLWLYVFVHVLWSTNLDISHLQTLAKLFIAICTIMCSICLYSNINWGRRKSKAIDEQQSSTSDNEYEQFGLSWYPKSYVDTVRMHQNSLMGGTNNYNNKTEISHLLSTTTTTFIAGCPNGGPIASVTVPLLSSTSTSSRGGGGASGFGHSTTIRIMNNAGGLISTAGRFRRGGSCRFR